MTLYQLCRGWQQRHKISIARPWTSMFSKPEAPLFGSLEKVRHCITFAEFRPSTHSCRSRRTQAFDAIAAITSSNPQSPSEGTAAMAPTGFLLEEAVQRSKRIFGGELPFKDSTEVGTWLKRAAFPFNHTQRLQMNTDACHRSYVLRPAQGSTFTATRAPQPMGTVCSSTSSQEKPAVGFVGLGNMGRPMALNILKGGYKLVAFDSKQEATTSLVQHGAIAAVDFAQVAQEADVVITMLPSPTHVKQVYTGQRGFFSLDSPVKAALFIDSSTVDPATSKKVSAAAAKCKIQEAPWLGGATRPVVMDAPVSGGVPGAQAGTLTFMVGGDERAFQASQPILKMMGKRAIFCGPSGSGSVAKLCNNLALAIQMAGVSEALALGQKLGLDPALLSSIFNTSSARCWSSDTYNPAAGVLEGVPAGRGYKGGFSSALMHKDLALARAAAESCDAQFIVGQQVLQMYDSIMRSGGSLLDFSVVFHDCYGGKPSNTAT